VIGVAAADLDELRSRLGVAVPDDVLLESLTHRSYAYENGALRPNERLEFLGDAVLGVVVTDALYHRHPDLAEGHLAKMRAATVNSRALADVARGIGLGEFLRLGKGENATGGRDKTSILADALEAVFGAVYVSAGLPAATGLILRIMDPLLARTAELGAGLDWKTSLQELTARLGLGVPEYIIRESGPDHDKTFVALVRLSDGDHGSGTGNSKKVAEQHAARHTFEGLVGSERGTS
jgi:ribonuclease-3